MATLKDVLDIDRTVEMLSGQYGAYSQFTSEYDRRFNELLAQIRRENDLPEKADVWGLLAPDTLLQPFSEIEYHRLRNWLAQERAKADLPVAQDILLLLDQDGAVPPS